MSKVKTFIYKNIYKILQLIFYICTMMKTMVQLFLIFKYSQFSKFMKIRQVFIIIYQFEIKLF